MYYNKCINSLELKVGIHSAKRVYPLLVNKMKRKYCECDLGMREESFCIYCFYTIPMSHRLKNNIPIKKWDMRIEGANRTREIVRRRDNWTCQSCHKKWTIGNRRFDVHHLNGLCGKRSRKYDKVSEIAGLITLCHKCHFNHLEHSNKFSP